MQDKTKQTDCKSVPSWFGGANPSAPTNYGIFATFKRNFCKVTGLLPLVYGRDMEGFMPSNPSTVSPVTEYRVQGKYFSNIHFYEYYANKTKVIA